jgi:hypothetical protein
VILLRARAVGGEHYCEVHDVRHTRLEGPRLDALDQAMRWLLRATTPGELLDLEAIEVGIAQLPFVDGDYEEGGDPGGKVMLPDERKGASAS